LQVSRDDFIAGFVDSATPRFNLFLKYARVELAPPTPADIPQIRSGIQKLLTGFRTGKWKETTVKVCILISLDILDTQVSLFKEPSTLFLVLICVTV
jgi:F-type H+-transporting ATPase subunit g